MVVALGHPAHTSQIVESHGDLRYYKDDQNNYYVPKKALEDIVLTIE